MSGHSLTLIVLTPEGILLKAEQLYAVSVPLVDGGTIGIRPSHAALIAETTQGKIVFRQLESSNSITLHTGILDIRKDVVTILTSGEVSATSQEGFQPTDTEYYRLMQTLINRLYPEQETLIEK